jgi:hypothetical protein
VIARGATFATALALATLSWTGAALAVDLPKVADTPLRLDVTETSIVSQRFGAREGEIPTDQGFGQWLNRLNLALNWGRWTLGARLDSALYWNRAEDQSICPPASTLLPCLTPDWGTPSQQARIQADGASRFRNSIYPAKLWVTYAAPGLEVTVGDAYVQFGRGLILSMRKIDELGLDNTVRGAKVAWQSDMFAATVVAGLANPSRVDEASGRALFLPTQVPGRIATPTPLFGSDRIIGAEIQAGRGLPVTLTTHAVRFTRCAPFHYDSKGGVGQAGNSFVAGDTNDIFNLGSCDPNDTTAWLSSVGSGAGPAISASEIEMAGQGVEIPSLWGHGKIYVEGALQHRYRDAQPDDPHADGNALYAAVSADAGPVTNTLEIKSYRNFYPVSGAVDQTHASAFSNVQYSVPPTTELLTQDAEFGFFSVCVDGGRLRTDVRLTDGFTVYGTGAYYHSKTEIANGHCDGGGHTLSGSVSADLVQTFIWDGLSGVEWTFDGALSHLYASFGARDDVRGTGDPYYRELHTEYDLVKHIAGPYSVELTGRHRLRREDSQNIRAPTNLEQPWQEGENYTALKISPKWVFSQGIEYTTLIGLPTYYVNGAVRYNFKSDSSVVLFVGEQRGGLRCVSGVCRLFPAYEGMRMELTLRF